MLPLLYPTADGRSIHFPLAPAPPSKPLLPLGPLRPIGQLGHLGPLRPSPGPFIPIHPTTFGLSWGAPPRLPPGREPAFRGSPRCPGRWCPPEPAPKKSSPPPLAPLPCKAGMYLSRAGNAQPPWSGTLRVPGLLTSAGPSNQGAFWLESYHFLLHRLTFIEKVLYLV